MRKKITKGLVLFFSFIFVFALGFSGVNAASDHKGIDVSVWQGDIDFRKVKDDGINYVYIRACEGANYVDTKFERNYENARKEGINVGFYQYVTARNTKEARDQAHFFYSLIKDKSQDLRPAMDFEELGGLNKKEANDIAVAYLDTLKKLTKYTPAFYSDAYDVESVWENELKEYPLWVADYGASEPYTTGIWGKWSGFQYESRGSVNGINGHVDMDKFKDEMLISQEEKDTSSCKGYISYTVKSGETLTEIAKKFNTTREELIKLNDLRLIHPGEKLLIKK